MSWGTEGVSKIKDVARDDWTKGKRESLWGIFA